MRSLSGRLLGAVEQIELDPLSGRSTSVLVGRRRAGLRSNRIRVDAASIALIDPWRRLVMVSLPDDRRPVAWGRAVYRAGVRAGQAVAIGVSRARPAFQRFALVAAPVVARSLRVSLQVAVWLGTRLLFLLAFGLWLYATAVFVVVRAGMRLLAFVLGVLAATAVRVAPRLAHAAARAAGRPAA